MKILQVIDSLYAGGAESLLKNLLIEAKKYDDFEIDVCTLYSRNIFKQDIKKAEVKVFDFGLSFKYNFVVIIKLINLIKRGKYDLVHVHLFPADLFAAIATLFLPKRVVYVFSEHNVFNRRRSNVIFKLVDGFTYSRYKKIICVSSLVQESLHKWIPNTRNKTVVIKNAIPVKELVQNKEKIYSLLFVGRLEKAKGVDIFLRAVQIISENYKRDLRVAIVGGGNLEKETKSLAKDLRVAKMIEFLGVRNDVAELMKKSKVFILPSRWEGLPIVLLEAMANGIPVVSTPVGGIPELLKNGKDSILVEPDNPKALAEAILKLLQNENLRKNMINNAFEKVKKEYSIENYTFKLLNFYKEVLNERRSKPQE
jgi:glycosyltransferase involved in cell wall biosynthesis